MRLTCPNCEAQYEVPDDAIPEDGRDVQCSNCGHTWFADNKPTPPMRPAPEDVPAASKRVPVSDEVRSVLQQEAQRELAARGASLDPTVEVQEDLDLTAPPAPTTRTQIVDEQPAPRPRRTKQPAPAKEPTGADRRSQLPDIEEINSTLNADAGAAVKKREKAKPVVDNRKKRKRGFRIGFTIAVLVLAAATAIYVFAPDIAVALPNLADEVNNYVLWVNDTRQALFKWAEDAIAALTASTGTADTGQDQAN